SSRTTRAFARQRWVRASWAPRTARSAARWRSRWTGRPGTAVGAIRRAQRWGSQRARWRGARWLTRWTPMAARSAWRRARAGAGGRPAGGGGRQGASACAATGLVLSELAEPNPQSYGFTLLAGTLGGLGGWGASMRAADDGGRADPAGALAGSTVSFVGG